MVATPSISPSEAVAPSKSRDEDDPEHGAVKREIHLRHFTLRYDG
jgi:hypothetical protein